MRYTAAFKLTGPLAAAAAVEWTDIDAPLASGAGWEACVKLPNGDWRFSSHAIVPGEAACWRDPGLFDNIGLRYRLGATSPWSPISASRKETTLVAVIEEVPPLVVSAATLTGAGKIGAAVTLDPGVWTGTPAPSLAQQWRRDGADIPGATLASYTPGAADDRTDLTCAVTASSPAGTAVATAGPIRITHVAPVAAGNLFEEIFDQGSGAQTVAAAGDFTGLALSFAVTGAGASIDAATGVVSIPTDVALSGETVMVTASNSGGSAASSFLVTIEAAEVELPPALTVAEWGVGAVADPLLAGNPLVGMIRVLSGPALGATRLYRTSLNPTDGYYPGKGFEVCIRHPDTANYANCWLWRSNRATDTFHLLDAKIGQTIQTVVRYALDNTATVAVEDAVFSLDSDRKSWVVTGAPVFTAQPTLSGTGRINSPVMFNAGTATGTPTKLKSWYLNGVAISGLTAGSYTPVSADLGKALTGREVATNVAGSTTSNFTNTITIIAATGDYVTVTNKADLQIELNRAAQGRIIECDENNYAGAVVATSGAKTFGQRVTIVARDRLNPPIFTEAGFDLSGWSGLIFDGLHFVNSRVDSQGDPAGKINLINCANIKIIDCFFDKQHESLRTDNSTNMEVAYCTFERQGMESMRAYAGQTNLWIHHCKVWRTAVNESRTGESDRHPDGFQLAVNGTNTPPNGVRVEDNWIENLQTGHSMHGVFFGNNATRAVANGGLGKSLAESGYRNIAVRRNYIHTGHIQGIYFEGMTDGVAEGNLMRTIPGVTNNGDKPTVYLNWEKFVNIDLINNVTPRSFYMSDAPASQVSQVGNVVSTTAVPTGWGATDVGLTLANPGAPRVGQYAAR